MIATSAQEVRASRPTLRVLILEGEPSGTAPVVEALKCAGYALTYDAVGPLASLPQRLATASYDLILAACDPRNGSVAQVLETLRSAKTDIPLIVISSETGDEAAVECIKQGADDYVPLGHPERIFPAVERALRDKYRRETQARLEEQLRQSHKMEAIGRLAGGIAHDFNNLLTAISGYSELLLSRLGKEARERHYVEEIRKAGDRAAALTRQLLAFGRRQVLAPQILDLNAVVKNLEKMLRRLIGEDIQLTVVAAKGLGRVRADVGQIEQVILNLAINARDAMPRGGKLVIESSNAELNSEAANHHLTANPGRYAVLSVADTGCGMDAETQAHLFEPFFTRKEPGIGTGLGLATVYGIVKQSGGHIDVSSEIGKGTTFRVYLSCVDDAVTATEIPRPFEDLPRGTETVLLVEDEPSVRELISKVLEATGYAVLEAAHGEDALRVAAAHQGPIHLLLSDVIMPRMGGPELLERLGPARREMKALFVSGYPQEHVTRQGILDPTAAYLQKPFTPEDLARKVREVLDGIDSPCREL